MARKRMITSDVIGTDKFFSLSLDARGLYMHLNSVADDDGFIASPQSTTIMVGGTKELLRELIDAGYIMEMDSGICLVTHWFMHNTLKSNRYNPTIYYADRSQVHLCDKVYCFGECPDLDSFGNPVEPQKRVGKKKKEKNSLVEESESSPPTFIPTREQLLDAANDIGYKEFNVDLFMAYYRARNWLGPEERPLPYWKFVVKVWAEREKQFPKSFERTKKNTFNNFKQREYDFEELEKALLLQSAAWAEGEPTDD